MLACFVRQKDGSVCDWFTAEHAPAGQHTDDETMLLLTHVMEHISNIAARLPDVYACAVNPKHRIGAMTTNSVGTVARCDQCWRNADDEAKRDGRQLTPEEFEATMPVLKPLPI